MQEIFISNQDHDDGSDMWDFEVRVGNSLDNEGNDNARCSPLYTLLPGHVGTIVCKNGTLGRYVNIRVDRDDVRLSLCEVAVIGVGKIYLYLSPDIDVGCAFKIPIFCPCTHFIGKSIRKTQW